MNDLTQELIALARDVAAQKGIALSTLSSLIADDGKLLTGLADGQRDITTGRYLKLRQKLEAIRADGSAAGEKGPQIHVA